MPKLHGMPRSGVLVRSSPESVHFRRALPACHRKLVPAAPTAVTNANSGDSQYRSIDPLPASFALVASIRYAHTDMLTLH